MWTAAIWAFAPFDSQPAQIFEHRRDKLGPAAVGVEILVAKNERATELVRPLSSNQERTRVAEVQIAGGGRRETAAIDGSGKHIPDSNAQWVLA